MIHFGAIYDVRCQPYARKAGRTDGRCQQTSRRAVLAVHTAPSTPAATAYRAAHIDGHSRSAQRPKSRPRNPDRLRRCVGISRSPSAGTSHGDASLPRRRSLPPLALRCSSGTGSHLTTLSKAKERIAAASISKPVTMRPFVQVKLFMMTLRDSPPPPEG